MNINFENGNKRRVYKNYLDAKKGDMVIAYESTPTKAIVGLCVVEEELKDNNLHWRGSANQRVIDVKKTLGTGEIVLYG